MKHTALKFPRYCRRKTLKSGRWGYFFEPPTWARKQGCPVKAEALGTEHAAAVERTENVLLPAFDSWRSRGLTDMVPASPVPGTFDWLAGIFKAHQKWTEIDHKTQRLYEQGLALFANHKLKDGSRAGSKQISDFTKDSSTQFTRSCLSWKPKTLMATSSSASGVALQMQP